MRISNSLQIVLLLTFLLPFFQDGCKTAETEPETEMADSLSNQGSLADQQIELIDSINLQSQIDSTSIENNNQTKPNVKQKINNLLFGRSGNYTGFGIVKEYFECYIFYGYGVFLSFILWIISLIIKYKDFNNIFHLRNILGFVSLIFTGALGGRLWGLWVCLSWALVMIIYDTVLLLKKKKSHIEL